MHKDIHKDTWTKRKPLLYTALHNKYTANDLNLKPTLHNTLKNKNSTFYNIEAMSGQTFASVINTLRPVQYECLPRVWIIYPILWKRRERWSFLHYKTLHQYTALKCGQLLTWHSYVALGPFRTGTHFHTYSAYYLSILYRNSCGDLNSTL